MASNHRYKGSYHTLPQAGTLGSKTESEYVRRTREMHRVEKTVDRMKAAARKRGIIESNLTYAGVTYRRYAELEVDKVHYVLYRLLNDYVLGKWEFWGPRPTTSSFAASSEETRLDMLAKAFGNLDPPHQHTETHIYRARTMLRNIETVGNPSTTTITHVIIEKVSIYAEWNHIFKNLLRACGCKKY